jgi:hypothetical protein
VNEGRNYYHINWTAFDKSGGEKVVPLYVSDADGERVVLVFDSFKRAKRYMHTFLAKNGLVRRRMLARSTAVITVRGPVLGSPDPAHIFSVGGKTSAEILARTSRKSSVNYALLNPSSLKPSPIQSPRVPLAEL